MFGIDPTPFDVRLVAFGIPIRVHPSFWLGSILFGSNVGSNQLIFIWVICAFISILVHEMGHALTAESFGWPTDIVLYFGGGLAISQRNRNNTPWRSIAVSLMGPAAGFLLFGLIFGIERMMGLSNDDVIRAVGGDQRYYWFKALDFLWFMNLYWGLLNLLPVLPLDGGNILQALCHVIGFRNPLDVTLKVGVVVAGAAAYYFFKVSHQTLAGMIMLMICVQSAGALQSRR
jgi:stage IV sporulation protein FB